MQSKLGASEFGADLVAAAIDRLQQQGLQSDHRFTESYVHSRLEKGYGPVRIRQELRDKGVTSELIEEILNGLETDWAVLAAQVRTKKFGAAKPENFRERARQSRFLQYRGFTSEQIHNVFK